MAKVERFCRLISEPSLVFRSSSPAAGVGTGFVELNDIYTNEPASLPSNLLEWWPDDSTEDEVKAELL